MKQSVRLMDQIPKALALPMVMSSDYHHQEVDIEFERHEVIN